VVKLLLWLLLLVFCWPLAVLTLVLYPIVWLLLLPFRLVGIAVDGVFELLPFRLVGIAVDGVFELLRTILFLPARILRGGHRA